MVMAPLVKADNRGRLRFRGPRAVRHKENDWKRTMNSALKDSQPESYDILQELYVPPLDSRGEVITD